LQELACTIYRREDYLPATFDKVERLYQDVLGLDDPEKFRKRLITLPRELQASLSQVNSASSTQALRKNQSLSQLPDDQKKQLSKADLEKLKRQKKDEEERLKHQYAYLQKNSALRRLNIRNEIEWNHLNKITASDWNIALNL
jgi:hypothetical protein